MWTTCTLLYIWHNTILQTFYFIKNSCPNATHSRFFHAQLVTETITRKSCLFTCTRQTVGNCCPIFWVNMYQDIHMCYTCAWTGTDKNYWSLQRSLLTDGFFNVIFEHIPQFRERLESQCCRRKKPGGRFQSSSFVMYWSSTLTDVHFSSFN